MGGEGDVPEKAKEHLEKIYPNAKIVGYHEGFFKEDSEEKVIEEINSLKPNVLFVAMGAPIQEKWIYENRDKLKVDTATGYLVKDNAVSTGMIWKVVKEYTMPDGQPGVKLQRIN